MTTFQLNEKKEYVISEVMFQEVKDAALGVWEQVDQDYYSGLDIGNEMEIVTNMINTHQTYMYIINSFVQHDRRLLISRLSKTIRNAVKFGYEYAMKTYRIYSQNEIDCIFANFV